MAFISASLRDSERHSNAPRLLTEVDSEQEIAKRRKITSSATDTSSDNLMVVDDIDIQSDESTSLYKPLVKLSSKLGVLNKCTGTLSEVSQIIV